MVNFLISDLMDKIQETRSKNQRNKIQEPKKQDSRIKERRSKKPRSQEIQKRKIKINSTPFEFIFHFGLICCSYF